MSYQATFRRRWRIPQPETLAEFHGRVDRLALAEHGMSAQEFSTQLDGKDRAQFDQAVKDRELRLQRKERKVHFIERLLGARKAR